MNFGETIKGMIFKKSSTGDQRRNSEPLADGRRQGESENPYLSARRTWNSLFAADAANRQMWQIFGILALLVALGAVGGVVHIGSQSKFVPYVVEVDKLGQRAAVAPADRAAAADQRVVRSDVASFISSIRMVTPDIALQRKAVFNVYAMLSAKDPAAAKANEYLNGTEDSNPFNRAEKEMVSIEVDTVLKQTADTWQIDWIETVRDRQGVLKEKPYRMRALVTVYTAEANQDPKKKDELNITNPLSDYVRDFTWSKQL